MNENEIIKKSLSCLHASENTIEEVIKMAGKKKKASYTVRKIAVTALAACLIFALAVTAAAYRNGAFKSEEDLSLSEFVNIAFGTGIDGQKAYDLELRDKDGNLTATEHYPNIERMEADPELASELIGSYIRDKNETLRFNGCTLSIYSSVLDENGIGVLYFELDDPDGIGLDRYAADINEDGFVPLRIDLRDSEGQSYDVHCIAESDSFSSTHALYAAYLTPFHPFDGKPLTLTFKWYGEETGEYSTDIDTQKLVPCADFSADGANIKISPLGMIADNSVSGKSVIIRYSDGNSYIVEDSEHVNYLGSVIDSTSVAYAFNRLVPVDDIESVEISSAQN